MATNWNNPQEIQQKRNQAIAAGYSPKEVDSFIDKQRQQMAVENLVVGGKLDINKVAESDPVTANKIMQKNPTIKSLENPADKKNKEAGNAITNFINNLESHYQKAGGADVGFGPLARIIGIGKDMQGEIGLNPDAKLYNNQKQGFAATLKSLTGDTGVLTDQDYERLSKLLPGLGSTGPEAKGALNDLRSQLAAKYASKPTQTTINPKEKNILQVLMPSTVNTAIDANASLKSKGEEDIQNKGVEMLKGLQSQFLQTRDPKMRTDIRNKMQEVNSYLRNRNTDFNKSFSEDINKDYLSRGLTTGTELATAAELPGLTKSLLNIPGKIAGAAGGRLTSSQVLSAARNTAAKDISLDSKPLIEAGENYVKNIDPAAQKAWETLKPAVENTKSVSDLLEKLSAWGSKAYTKSGDKRAITEGLLKEHLYRKGRDAVAEIAPEVANFTRKISNRKGVENLIGKAAIPAATAAAASVPISLLLYKILGQKR
jgi:hypothetical protein